MTDKDDPVFDLETRRNFLTLLAGGEIDDLNEIEGQTGVNWRDMALQAIAMELIGVSFKVENDLTMDAVRVIGAMVNGLFGADMNDDADQLLLGLHGAGRRMREHIGLGPPALVRGGTQRVP